MIFFNLKFLESPIYSTILNPTRFASFQTYFSQNLQIFYHLLLPLSLLSSQNSNSQILFKSSNFPSNPHNTFCSRTSNLASIISILKPFLISKALRLASAKLPVPTEFISLTTQPRLGHILSTELPRNSVVQSAAVEGVTAGEGGRAQWEEEGSVLENRRTRRRGEEVFSHAGKSRLEAEDSSWNRTFEWSLLTSISLLTSSLC